MVKHLFFRKNNPSLYDLEPWNVPRRLPSGIAAVAAGVLSFELVIPSMSQVWFTGPIAHTTGDIGFEVAFVFSALL
jgi:purine-cytosine permease-like protein